MIDINRLLNVKIKSFETEDDAFHYFNVKNIAIPSGLLNEKIARDVFCDDIQRFTDNDICISDFIQTRNKTYKNTYNLTDEDFDADP